MELRICGRYYDEKFGLEDDPKSPTGKAIRLAHGNKDYVDCDECEAAEAKLREATELFQDIYDYGSRDQDAMDVYYARIEAWLAHNQTQAKQSKTPESPEERG